MIDENSQLIETSLLKHGITNFTIQPDGTVDVDGDVNLRNNIFQYFPFKFGSVSGNFICDSCHFLLSLVGSPTKLGGSFSCVGCRALTSLDGAPQETCSFSASHCLSLLTLAGSPVVVKGDFSCVDCTSLSNLAGGPQKVSGNFYASYCNNLTSLEGFKTLIGRGFSCGRHNIKHGGIGLILCHPYRIIGGDGMNIPFEIIERYLQRPEDIFECQAELIEAGYPEHAKL